jgi:hypothetical protein
MPTIVDTAGIMNQQLQDWFCRIAKIVSKLFTMQPLSGAPGMYRLHGEIAVLEQKNGVD